MINVNRQGEVWVFAEQHNGQLEDTPIELMSKARKLADTLGVKLAAALLGNGVSELATKLIHCGADKVYLAEHPLLGAYQTNSYAKVIYDLIHKYEPQIVLYGATITGRDLAPRIASAAKAGLTADCTDLQIGNHTTVADKKEHKNLLFQIRPAFGGNIVATIINLDRWPQMATVREGVMPAPEADMTRAGEIIEEQVNLSGEDLPMEILDEHKRPKKVDLKASRIIVAGGAGVPDDFDLDRYNESKVRKVGERSFEELLDAFAAFRGETIDLVATLSLADLDKVGRHPFLGLAPVEDILKLMYRHAQIHQRDIRRYIKSWGGSA